MLLFLISAPKALFASLLLTAAPPTDKSLVNPLISVLETPKDVSGDNTVFSGPETSPASVFMPLNAFPNTLKAIKPLALTGNSTAFPSISVVSFRLGTSEILDSMTCLNIFGTNLSNDGADPLSETILLLIVVDPLPIVPLA